MADEHRNPFGGFAFSGSEEVLRRLIAAAESDGLKLIPVDLGDGIVRFSLPPEHSFAATGADLVNRAQAGEFGEISLALMGSPAQPPH